MDWKESFKQDELVKGYQLFQEGKVNHVFKDNLVITGVVHDDNQDNLVEAMIDNGEIMMAECSCEKGKSGDLCAHEAAFLFYLESLDSLDNLPSAPAYDPKNFEEDLSENLVDPSDSLESEPEGEIEPNETEDSFEDFPEEDANEKDNDLVEDEKEQEEAPIKSVPVKAAKSFTNMVSQIDPEQLQNFVLKYALKHQDFQDALEIYFLDSLPLSMEGAILDEINTIISSYEGNDGIIPLDQTDDFEQELSSYLRSKGGQLIESRHFNTLYKMVRHALEMLEYIELDDFSDAAGPIAETALSLLEEGIPYYDESLSLELVNWINQILPKESMSFAQDALKSFLDAFYESPMYLDEKLTAINARLKKTNNPEAKEHLLGQKYSILKKRPNGEKELQAFIEENTDSLQILDYRIQEAVINKDAILASELLKQSIEQIDKANQSLPSYKRKEIRPYSRLLIEQYLKLDQKEEAVDQLKKLILDLHQTDFYTINKLKSLVDENEWKTIREQIENVLPAYQRMDFYAQEDMEDKLIDEIKENLFVNVLSEYESRLTDHEDDVAKLWLELAENEMKRARNRKDYSQAVFCLKKAGSNKNCKEDADKLAEKWKKAYIRRKALLDILSKAGY